MLDADLGSESRVIVIQGTGAQVKAAGDLLRQMIDMITG